MKPRSRFVIEAEIRTLMAEHVAIEDRGFDSWAKRAVLRHQIDLLYDELELVQMWRRRT